MKPKCKIGYKQYDQHEGERFDPSRSTLIRNQSCALFNRMLVNGYLRHILVRMTGESNKLYSLSNSLKNEVFLNAMDIGLKTVPLQRVVGLENHCNDFDNQFNPLTEQNRLRWLEFSDKVFYGDSLPVVELIQIGQSYYARDGHHQISISRSLGKIYIDAKEIVFQISKRTLQTDDPLKKTKEV